MNLVLGRALADQKLNRESIDLYQSLLKGNEAFLPGLTQLRSLYSTEKAPDKALKYAARMAEERPWDPTAGQLLSVSQAEDEQFPPALKYLREQSTRDPGRQHPCLYTTMCLPVRIRAAIICQVTSHLEKLSAENYRFITPENLGSPDERRRVTWSLCRKRSPLWWKTGWGVEEGRGKAVYVGLQGQEGTPGSLSRAALAAMVLRTMDHCIEPLPRQNCEGRKDRRYGKSASLTEPGPPRGPKTGRP